MLLFFDLSSGEVLLILFVAFIVLGPKRIPEVARTIGKVMNEMKHASAGFKNEINKEVQRLDKETKLSEFLSEKNLTSIDQFQRPVPETKEFISGTSPNIKAHEPQESSSEVTTNKKIPDAKEFTSEKTLGKKINEPDDIVQ
jgi:sec-independent protein translocase protein TatB